MPTLQAEQAGGYTGSEVSLLSYCLVMTPEPPARELCFATCKAFAQPLSPLIFTKNLAREKSHWAQGWKTRVQGLQEPHLFHSVIQQTFTVATYSVPGTRLSAVSENRPDKGLSLLDRKENRK